MNKKYKILVGEDDLEDQIMLEEYFKEYGFFECGFEKNGKRVLEYLQQTRNEADLPRLIVLDLNMPIFNGTQTLLQIKQNIHFNKIPVIIYSTSNNEHEKRKCLSFGAVDYLVKPLTVDEGRALTKKLLTFVDQPEMEAPSMPESISENGKGT
jgi:CheY-like chemotaxis protein